MRTKTLYKKDVGRTGISRFPNFHRTGSIAGMKELYMAKMPFWYVAAITSTTYQPNLKFITI